MDQSVLDAQIRWPDVPAAYGWLSLTARGEWRLHPLGDAQQGGLGQGISNSQILTFIGRNYSAQPDGAWYFQNGPQRVYVRLEAAPFILRADTTTGALVTHTGLTITHITQWVTDDSGQLYAQTNLGAARVDDRDLARLAEVLGTGNGRSLFDYLEQDTTAASFGSQMALLDPTGHFAALTQPAPLCTALQKDLPKRLGFIANPAAPFTHSAPLPLK